MHLLRSFCTKFTVYRKKTWLQLLYPAPCAIQNSLAAGLLNQILFERIESYTWTEMLLDNT